LFSRQDEIIHVNSAPVDTHQSDRVAVDGDQSVNTTHVGDGDGAAEITSIDPECRNIQEVLAARRIGVEAADRVVVEASGEDKPIVAGAAAAAAGAA